MPITITLRDVKTIDDLDGSTARHADFYISDDTDTYAWSRGGLPEAGDVQTLLDAEADALWAKAAANGATVTTTQTAKQSIRALADKANNFAAEIALCFAAILESEEAGENAAATFTRITNALNDTSVGNGYRSAVMTAFTAKSGLAFDFGNLGVVLLTTKQQFNLFTASFFTRWAFLVREL